MKDTIVLTCLHCLEKLLYWTLQVRSYHL
uniref:Uncharacterized protein n=1 Tax=Arundo donax TaxID=35708 RepID=A0A0A9FN35_ARUDO